METDVETSDILLVYSCSVSIASKNSSNFYLSPFQAGNLHYVLDDDLEFEASKLHQDQTWMQSGTFGSFEFAQFFEHMQAEFLFLRVVQLTWLTKALNPTKIAD